MKKRILVPLIAVGIFFTTASFKSDFFEIAKQIEIFTTLFKELNMNYVDEVTPATLMDKAIKGMLEDLDPYTVYWNEQQVEDARITNSGVYTGIGATAQTKKDKIIIIEPYKDYPADKAGLKAGDEIIKIGDIIIADFENDAGELLKGAAGTKVEVTYLRQGKTEKTTITRNAVELHAVPFYKLIDNNIGYIVLSQFNSKTTQETKAALIDLKSQGATKLILDLRGNPGGLLNEAISVVNLFIDKGEVITTTKSVIDKYNKVYKTTQKPVDTEIPLVVLINGRSASASEIVSGSLQDLDRAVILGSRSFGKGLVQRPKTLTYGTQLKITISRYYTPSGRCIQALDYANRDAKGNAIRIDSKEQHEFKTKNGRPVFDGGGVQPDQSFEISNNTAITDAIINDFLLFDYATEYYYKHSNLTDINNFKLKDSDFKDFKNYLNSNNFSFITETEKSLKTVFENAKKEELDDNIKTDYTTLLNNLKNSKELAINENKEQILNLLTDEIVKRYVYREGLYDYYKTHNLEIMKASEILADPSKYMDYLR